MIKKAYALLLIFSCLALGQVLAEDAQEASSAPTPAPAAEVAEQVAAPAPAAPEAKPEEASMYSKVMAHVSNFYNSIARQFASMGDWFSKKWSEMFQHKISESESKQLAALPCPAPTPSLKPEAPELVPAPEAPAQEKAEEVSK